MPEPAIAMEMEGNSLKLYIEGEWCIGKAIPDFVEEDADKFLSCTQLCLIAKNLSKWDSMLMLFVLQCHRWCLRHEINLNVEKMPVAVARLLKVATAVMPYKMPEGSASDRRAGRLGLSRLQGLFEDVLEFLAFVGELIQAIFRFLMGRARLRSVDTRYFIEQVGPRGLGIITLISVLVGMILAYLGAVQLRQFGAQIYVADLVSIGMTREMGALMTGIILSGRTGAAYASQLGAMQVNEEIDAIKILGMSGMEFLILPRMFALVFIMPLVCVYSDVMGMLGGAITAIGMDISWTQYLQETKAAVSLVDFLTGIIKSIFFAILIGIAGCQAGLNCGRDSAAVGAATTTAVVRAIVYLIVADAAFNILFDKMGI